MFTLGSYAGRPKEEGSHTPLRISVNKFVSEALEKVPNKSKFLEEVAQPILEKLDPGDASYFLWQIDDFLSRGIEKANREKDFKQAYALSWLGNCLEDARKLCGAPPPGFRLPRADKPEEFGFCRYLKWRKLHAEQKKNEELRELQAESHALMEIIELDEDNYTDEKAWIIREKWRKRIGLET